MVNTSALFKKLMLRKSFRESTPRTREMKMERALARRRKKRENLIYMKKIKIKFSKKK
jgi:hypothetical protein